MQAVKENDVVRLEYEGTLKSGELFESTADTGPLEFRVGAGEVWPAFEKAVLGMTVGEEKTITLPPEAAHGKHREELRHTVERKVFSDRLDPQPGMVLSLTVEKDGQSHQVPAMVESVTDSQVTVDFNHPLAGRELTFRLTLKEINPSRD